MQLAHYAEVKARTGLHKQFMTVYKKDMRRISELRIPGNWHELFRCEHTRQLQHQITGFDWLTNQVAYFRSDFWESHHLFSSVTTALLWDFDLKLREKRKKNGINWAVLVSRFRCTDVWRAWRFDPTVLLLVQILFLTVWLFSRTVFFEVIWTVLVYS